MFSRRKLRAAAKGISCLLVGVALAAGAQAADEAVVINEIMYHPPGDSDLPQFIELFNRGSNTVALGGWKFTKGITFSFSQAAQIQPGAFLVIARDAAAFNSIYGRNPSLAGTFAGKLSRGGAKLELSNSQGKIIDAVKYSDRAPWPNACDGYGPSLERISVADPSDEPQNWSASKMSQVERPGGTPGRQNDAYSNKTLPLISAVEFKPTAAGTPLSVSASVNHNAELKSVLLLFRSVSTGNPGGVEQSIPMTKGSGDSRHAVYQGTIPAQKAGALIRFRIKATSTTDADRFMPSEYDLRPTYTWFSYANTNNATIAHGIGIRTGGRESGTPRFSGPGNSPSARGGACFIYAPPGEVPQVFDHLRITPRHGGFKVRFHRDRTLRGMTVANLIFEGSPRYVLAEPLAYEVYRLAGVPAEQTEHVRVHLDGRQLGYMLLVEQPNKAFLSRNERDTGGDLFKLLWYGNGVVGKHEKKTNPGTGHDNLVKVIDGLNRTSGKAQWDFIEKHFNVDVFVNYFAVNMCIQNWDGFFNNYYTYHDLGKSGKWEIYPWDEDKTWGDYDGASQRYDWYEMPLSYGAKGDESPRDLRSLIMRGPFGGASWWRPAGYFSGPMLANPQFRQKFLKRVQELCQTVFTEEKLFPIIQAMEQRLRPEIEVRARATNENPDSALRRFQSDIQSFQNQVKHRRKFLLAETAKELGK